MNEPSRSGPQRPTDPATESRAFGPAFGYLVLALLVVAGSIGYWVSQAEEPVRVASSSEVFPSAWREPAPVDESASEPERAASSAAAVARPVARMRDPEGDQTPDLRDYLNAGENPSMAEVLDRLHRAGVYTGIGAFSPPGTSPPLVGIAVPEDFALPEGYVRHYQTTDDGQAIEPILMYAPDRQFVDGAGRPIEIPKDRVVRPEAAPPGLANRRIVIPAPVEADRPGT
ncbi:MAG TPA: hypothetical protein VFL64_08380 [Rhizobacter sp.]|nr:hypothetical protein [Rhizobacter sp.]